MKRPTRFLLTYVLMFPWCLLVWLMVLFIWALWGSKLHWQEGLWCELKPRSWPCRTWYRLKKDGKHVMNPVEAQPEWGMWQTWGGTSFGPGGFYGPMRAGGEGIDTDTEYHELIHTEQTQAVVTYSFVVQLATVASILLSGGTPNWWFHLGAWALAWPVFYGCTALVAWLRGEHGYEGNMLEESAYSQTEDWDERR